MSFRPADRQDIPALAELVIACGHTHRAWAGAIRVPTLEEEALEWELRFARTDAWVHLAEDDEDGRRRVVAAVAWAAATVSREDRTLVPGLAHVSAVFTAPDRWRRGLAADLLDLAEDAMRVAGYERARLWTLAGSPAERFYAARGWRPNGEREPYPPMGLEVVQYVRDLAR